MFLNKYFSKLVIGFLLIACMWYGKNIDSWGRNRIIDNDVVSYYAYLPAGLIFHDLSFSFMKELPADFDGKIWLGTAPNGKPILRMTMGLAILWMPFFVIAHLYAKVMGISAFGYSWPYSLSIFVAAIFYLFLGLVFLRKILLRYFSDIVTGITLLLIVLATNLMYYVISEPGMSHVFSFALITVFLHFTMKWIEKPEISSTLVLGSLAGLIVLIRPVNGLVLAFPVLVAISSVVDFKQRLFARWKLILLAGVAAFLMVLPQMIYWKVQTGHFVFNSYMDSGRFYFANPHLIDGLFGFRKGWLIYTPIMLFPIVGLLFLKRYAKDVLLSTTVFVGLFLFVVFSWWCWWYGGSYGARPMIDTYGILSIPLATFLSVILKSTWWKKGVVGLLLLFFVYLNQFQMSQYRTSLLHWDSMTPKAYRAIFLKKNWPDGYDKMIKVPDYEKALKGEKE
ncbi:MAG: hypothetical protein C0397_09635 [Odoribacter sp.]|nr:hypothetical protein [Odoribacter sp.]